MKRTSSAIAVALSASLVLSACGNSSQSTDASSEAPSSTTTSTSAAEDAHSGHGMEGMEDMEHPADGGPAPEGIAEATSPTYPVGTQVVLHTDHMAGMDGAPATIVGAFDTTTYSVSYTPTDGGAPITDHKWVVHEELVDPGQAPLADGTEVTLDADHMAGMMGAKATIDSSTQETVYMVDYTADGMTMKNHKWVTESEISPAE
ncbi:YdhK family protein [Corynebacterium lubricantis]|uniref:YdhK family protein n=1 Tax=Corynebacterium lubricantis TaxID=541095 RepID=UPI0003736A52|nr:YdhK family protein [Corynebacterium lubricantis]